MVNETTQLGQDQPKNNIWKTKILTLSNSFYLTSDKNLIQYKHQELSVNYHRF